jgi:quercetin dioxygenase-like cupin family protein
VVIRHWVGRTAEADFTAPDDWASGSEGLRRWRAVGEHTGAHHTGFDLSELDPGGSVPAHAHSFERVLYVLDGQLTLRTTEGAHLLTGGDYGLVPAGQPHALVNAGREVTRWADMQAPQPRSRYGGDTYLLPPLPAGQAAPIDVRDPRNRYFGHISAQDMDPARQTQDMLAVSASMRTALLVYSGITVKMMADSDLGAVATTMFMVQYVPGGFAGSHDHPFEETYLILDGEVRGTFDGQQYLLGPGDIAWAGAGCVHAFACDGPQPVRWLETQAPAPPPRHSYRFARDWDYLAGQLRQASGTAEGSSDDQ